MALKVFVSPLRYVQGPGAILQMGEQLEALGIRNPLILASPSARIAVESSISQGLAAKGIRFAFTDFGGETTWKEIERIKNVCIQGAHDAIVSCGGGKTLDAGRGAAAAGAINVEKWPPSRSRTLVPVYPASTSPRSRQPMPLRPPLPSSTRKRVP